jgi:hypothetical protein
MEVSTSESWRRWFTPVQALSAPVRAWSKRVQIRQEEWLLRHTTPGKLAWGGLFVALTLLAFTWFDGPELLQPILGGSTSALWAFMWLSVPLVPVGGRLFTTWAGAAARRADRREIIHLQRRGAIVIGTCVVFATVWAIYTHDFYTKAYTNFIALGIGTNIAMAQQKLKTNAPQQKASLPSTIILLSLVPVALFGLLVDGYMSIVGDRYASGLFGWLFDLMPELAVRTVVPPCFDFLSLFLVGYVLAGRTGARGWERTRLTVKVTVSGVGFLVGFILLGGYVGGWLADIYRTGHGTLPDQIRQLLAITVVTRTPAYLIGGFGAAVISGLGAKANTWVRTQALRVFRPGLRRITALEKRVATLETEKTHLLTTLGWFTLTSEIEEILESFRSKSGQLLNKVALTPEAIQEIEEIEGQLAASSIAPEALRAIGKHIQIMKEVLTEFRNSSAIRLSEMNGDGNGNLDGLLRRYPPFTRWISGVITDFGQEVEEARRLLDERITVLERRWNQVHEVWTTKS